MPGVADLCLLVSSSRLVFALLTLRGPVLVHAETGIVMTTFNDIELLNTSTTTTHDDRLRTLAGVGMHAARAWGNHDLLHQCIEVDRDSHWWHVLTSLGIAFDNRG